MITTVCMNPSFDKTATVEKLTQGEVNRLKDVRVDLGGKGLNVAIVLTRLGVKANCVGCLGEGNATEFNHLIAKEKVSFEAFMLPGDVRTNLKLYDESVKIITEFNEPGPAMDEKQLEGFLKLLEVKAEESDYAVLSGRLPVGCNTDTYQRCLQTLQGKKCILDSAGEPLLHGIKEKPYLVKPNLPEIESIVHKELKNFAGHS